MWNLSIFHHFIGLFTNLPVTILHITTIHNDSIAQLVEHYTFNVRVTSSSLVGVTNQVHTCLGLCVSFSVIICRRNYIIAGFGPIAQLVRAIDS